MLAPLVNHIWQSTAIVLGVAALALLLRRNGAQVRYWLWWTASVKFLVPFSLLTWLSSKLAGETPSIAYVFTQWPAALVRLAQPLGTEPGWSGATTALLGAWAMGFVLVVTGSMIRWRRVAAVIRAAAPCERVGFEAAWPRVLCTNMLVEPCIVGVFRPVLLLPQKLAERLPETQIRAVLEHELCHWRRHDNLTFAVHMVVEAVFWFHPLVWWIGTRLVEERERACDEAVVQSGHDREVYAEGILNVCEFYAVSSLRCVAGVSGAGLQERIVHIMRSQPMSPLNVAKKLVLAAAALCALLVPIAAGLVASRPAFAQDSSTFVPLVRIAPDYPSDALALGLEGSVVLQFTIARDGTTKDIVVMQSTHPSFAPSALAAFSRWRYAPQIVDGNPAEIEGVRTMIRFQLDRDPPPAGPGAL
jgi:bla regulator protein blaR1